MELHAASTDKGHAIFTKPNLLATETMNHPKHPLDLFLRIITVSLETNRIAANLPKEDIAV